MDAGDTEANRPLEQPALTVPSATNFRLGAMGMIFTSSTSRLRLAAPLRIEHVARPRVGDVVVVEVLNENPAYPNVELGDGALVRTKVGDRIVGALGSRQALHGYVGHAPESLEEGDTLALLNMGGVIGRFVDSTSSLGEPIRVRYLGTVVDDAGVVNLDRAALPPADSIGAPRPIVLAIGTCMNVGKTTTLAGLVATATREGYRVGAAKLAGVAAVRDLCRFADAGAVDVKSFLDCGIPSTVDAGDLAQVARTVLASLDGDLLIVELGDGVVGHYNVESILADPEIMASVAAVVVCAGDIMAAYGAKLYLDRLGVRVDAFSGIATENVAGSGFIEEWLGVPAVNGVKEPERLFATLDVGSWSWQGGAAWDGDANRRELVPATGE